MEALTQHGTSTLSAMTGHIVELEDESSEDITVIDSTLQPPLIGLELTDDDCTEAVAVADIEDGPSAQRIAPASDIHRRPGNVRMGKGQGGITVVCRKRRTGEPWANRLVQFDPVVEADMQAVAAEMGVSVALAVDDACRAYVRWYMRKAQNRNAVADAVADLEPGQ
jgi:hypothetical protein